ncbi:MAG: DUF4149 domain-containing protein [Euryarchaeota archaeon]|nr:DUF4149 domain-containing protein [Euryarchaeota archaeon]
MADPTLLFLHLLSLGAWIGAILHFSFSATPALFRAFPREEAGRVVGLLFPGYYQANYLAGGLSLATALAMGGAPGPRIVLLAAAFLLALLLGLGIGPRVRRLKEMGDSRFLRAHGVSMLLNLGVLGCATGALGLAALSLSTR